MPPDTAIAPPAAGPLVASRLADRASTAGAMTTGAMTTGAMTTGATGMAPARLQGFLDRADAAGVAGWAINPDSLSDPVDLVCLDNGEVISRLRADHFRQDLDKPALRDGLCAFSLSFPHGLDPTVDHRIEVQRLQDGAALPNSPAWIAAATDRKMMARSVDQALDRLISATGDIGELDQGVNRLVVTAGRLIRAHAGPRPASHAAFLARWRDRLNQLAPATRVLVITTKLPRPAAADSATGQSDTLMLLGHLAALRRLGTEIVLTAGDDMATRDPAIDALLAPFNLTLAAAPHAVCVEEVLQREAQLTDLVHIHGLAAFTRYHRLVRHYMPGVRIVLGVPALASTLARRMAVAAGKLDEHLFGLQRFEELRAFSQADAVLAASEADAAILRRALPPERVGVAPWPLDAGATQVPFAQQRGVAFLGRASHNADLDAARTFLDTILPSTREGTDLQPILAGPGWQEAFANRTGIRFTDGAEALRDARVVALPLRLGGGLNPAMLAGLAAGRPVVASPIAAEGFCLPAPLAAHVTADPARFAALVAALHEDADANAAASTEAARYVGESFAPARISAVLGRLAGLAF